MFSLLAALVFASPALPAAAAASSSDRLTRGVNPILRNDSAYDDLKVGPSSVVKVGPTDYRQWYEAIDAQNALGGGDVLSQTAYATSTDGTSWTKRGVVFSPLQAPSWENGEACPTSMHFDGSRWILFYHGGNNTRPRAIARAVSSTGTENFERSPSTPVLERGSLGSWDGGFVADAKVIPPWEGPDSVWRMYYLGQSAAGLRQVGLATSTDGISFEKVGTNPVLRVGPGGAWDDQTIHAFAPEWDSDLKIFRAWYVGKSGFGVGGAIGYAWSNDGVSWNRSAENPVLTSTASERIEDSIDAYRDDSRYRLVYGHYDLDQLPPLRGKGEAWIATATPPPPPPPSATVTASASVSASADDGDVELGSSSYPPSPHSAFQVDTTYPTVFVRKSNASSSYMPVRVALLRFDTSKLPDDAVVVSAQLILQVVDVAPSDSRDLVAEWYPAGSWPIDAEDWTATDNNTAHSGTPLSSIATGSRSFDLAQLASIDTRGQTALRLHVSGGTTAPTGPNDLSFASFDHPTLAAPKLAIVYRTG